MLFKPGDIVRDLDKESMFKGKQGVVISCQLRFWEPPEVMVRFDRELYLHWRHLSDDECPNGVCDIYLPHELQLNKDWDPEVYARRIFGTRWHTVYKRLDPLNQNELCMVDGCPAHQLKSIWFNIWGSVCNAYVCKEHAERYHRYCMDSFPWRRRIG